MKSAIVLVPLAIVVACSNGEDGRADGSDACNDVSSEQAGGSSADGAAGSSDPADASAESSDACGSGGSPDAPAECGPWGASGGDPAPSPLYCDAWDKGQSWGIQATFDGSILQIELHSGGGLGSWGDLQAVISPELGTLESIEPDTALGGIFDVVRIEVLVTPGATGGTVTVDGVLRGWDQCWDEAECPAHRVLQVELVDGGKPKVSMAPMDRLSPRNRVVRLLEKLKGARG